jgi:hypothetical protein
MNEVITDSAEQEKPGFFSKAYWANIADAVRFWNWSPRDIAVATLSGWQTALCWNFGGWFVATVWKPIVVPMAKMVWSWCVTVCVTVWNILTAHLH